VLDYIAAGIDPQKATIYLQSLIPEVAEISLLFGTMVTVPRLERVPTLKDKVKETAGGIPYYALLGYPVLQAADILGAKGDLVPVGRDQESHVELSREIAEKFNKTYKEIFPLPDVLIGDVGSLPGIDGNEKMGKSLGNAIYLSDSPDEVEKKVMSMYTDPDRIHPDDPGKVEGNPVFIYHDAFNDNKDEVQDLKERYKKGAVGDVEVKQKLTVALNKFLDPIRERRSKYENNRSKIDEIVIEGSKKAREVFSDTLSQMRDAMGINYVK
jgi:tryptophanyl-tRNA synthetase